MANTYPKQFVTGSGASAVLRGMASLERDPWQPPGLDPWSSSSSPMGPNLRENGSGAGAPPGFESGEATEASAAEGASSTSEDVGEPVGPRWTDEDWQKWRAGPGGQAMARRNGMGAGLPLSPSAALWRLPPLLRLRRPISATTMMAGGPTLGLHRGADGSAPVRDGTGHGAGPAAIGLLGAVAAGRQLAARPPLRASRGGAYHPNDVPAYYHVTWKMRCSKSEDGGGYAANGPKGPSEKLVIPTFSGEGDGGELGASARSYLRQVAAWERMTKLSKGQRALVLYQHLAGAAWVNVLRDGTPGSEDGVAYLREWVQQHYLDVEVTQIGRSLSDLFRKLKRKPAQTFRDYVAEFNRLLARVTECGCRLPDVASAWLFVDRAALDEGTEVSLLASVGNKYELRLLQQGHHLGQVVAQAVGEGWQTGNLVHHTEDDTNDDAEDLCIAYMTAMAKYKDHGKALGVDVEAVKRTAEARIQAAKAKSFCAACGQRGHNDAVCPKRRRDEGSGGDGRANKPQTIHIANEVFELRVDAGRTPLLAITDSACSRSVMGTAWFQRYLDMAGDNGKDVELIQERESFRFRASRIYESSFAGVVMIPLGPSWVAVRAAVIHGDIPLLLSRPLLASLGMVMDLATNRANFKAVNLVDYQLLTTETGHPAVPVDHSGKTFPDMGRLPKSWGPDGVAVLGPQRVYMVAQVLSTGDGEGLEAG